MRAAEIVRLTGGDRAGNYSLASTPTLDLVRGIEASLWFEEMSLTAPGESLPAFTTSGPGTIDAIRWRWTPDNDDVGTTRKLTLRAGTGSVSSRVTVRPSTAPPGAAIKLHVIGASFEDAAVPVNWLEYVDAYLAAAGVARTWLGTQKADGQSADVWHEGVPGSSFAWWIGEPSALPGTSPYVFSGLLDIPRYQQESLAGVAPDIALIDLGANGYTTARLDHPEDFTELVRQADVLLDAMLEAWPLAWVCPFLAVPCSAALHPLGDEHRQRRDRFLQLFGANLRRRIARGQRIAMPPVLANLHPVEAFPVSPEVLNDHYDQSGAVEMGAAVYGFIRRFTG